MKPTEFWKEVIAEAADRCKLALTPEQLAELAEAAEGAHDNYGLAFYSPPASDRYAEIEREHKAKLDASKRELERYRENAETAIKQALRQRPDAHVSIGEHGEVTRYDGRHEIIQ